MNDVLARIAHEVDLASSSHERLRLEFGQACAARVQHMLEDASVLDCLQALRQFLDGAISRVAFDEYVAHAAQLANQHQGSRSIDGVGHAAVSATYSVANALAGKALQAADYAAYAMVYGQGGYGAVADLASFEPEHAWQVSCLSTLNGSKGCNQKM